MADLDRDIGQIEALLRRLEKEYEQFLAGQLRREPAETENALQALIRTYANRTIQNNTLAFKFNTLVARYNSFRTVWSRRQREKEEGRSARPAAKPPAPAPERRAPAAAAPGEFLAVDPRREAQGVRALFQSYKHLREQCGEKTDALRLESFQKSLAEKVETIKRTYGCDAVLIRVVRDGDRTKIIAKPSRGAAAGGGRG